VAECKRLESARQETVRGFKSHTLRNVEDGPTLFWVVLDVLARMHPHESVISGS